MTQESTSPNPAQPFQPVVTSTGSSAPANQDASPGSTKNSGPIKKPKSQFIDEKLVRDTQDQIRNLIQEITELSRSNCSVEEFYEGFLIRTCSALASVGGVIWVLDKERQQVDLHYQINFKSTGLTEDAEARRQHGMLLKKLMQSDQSSLVPPQSGADNETGNPTDYLLVVGPLVIDNQVVGLIEIFQRPGAGPTTQRGYLRFVDRMATIGSDFLKDQRLRSFSEQQSMWQRVENFIKSVHSGLEPKQTAYTLANEARRLIECDRVSVALANGTRQRVQAVSGLDSIERRAEQVKLLNKLSTTVCKAGEPLWYSGDASELPPQIEKRLHEYLDKSHAKMIAILPLLEPESIGEDESSTKQKTRKNLGALIVEQLSDARLEPATKSRIGIVSDHGSSALNNSIEHHSIFLMPLWKALGKLTAPFRRTNLLKTTLLLSLIGLGVFAMCVVPWSFTLGANGQLIPEDKKEIFARIDGTLTSITAPKDPSAIVEANQPLASLINNDLMVEIEQIDGDLKQARAEYQKFARAESQRLEASEKIVIQGELARTDRKIKGLEKALAFKRQQAELLTIRSPIRGQVVNWQPRRTLLGRPVRRGQNLMTVVAPDSQWEIELELPERRVGHLLKSSEDSDQPLEVVFSLVSEPSQEFKGKVLEINRTLEVKSDDGNTATVKVRFDNEQIPRDLLRAGTRVQGRVQCGTRSVGYVIFHELIESTVTHFKYWF